jgi:cellulose synthase/poly-beta-1,6-N-acetylglucosamine synthase-like glycosyltransferase
VTDRAPPRISVLLLAWRQADVVGAAVDALLAQEWTGAPMQLVLSDDASPDATFDVIRARVAEYAGPHRIVLNRNERNCGALGGHVNALMRLADGELVVLAAGDDISLPQRCRRLAEAWDAAGRPSGSLHSAWQVFSDQDPGVSGVLHGRAGFDGMDARALVRSGGRGVLGATHAFTRDLYERFGPLPDEALFEDRALVLRSALAGRVLYVPDPLVRYRENPAALSHGAMYEDPARWERWIRGLRCVMEGFGRDYRRHCELEGVAPEPGVLRAIAAELARVERARPLAGARGLRRAVAAFHGSHERVPSDRLAFVLAQAGLRDSALYRGLSWVWRRGGSRQDAGARP